MAAHFTGDSHVGLCFPRISLHFVFNKYEYGEEDPSFILFGLKLLATDI